MFTKQILNKKVQTMKPKRHDLELHFLIVSLHALLFQVSLVCILKFTHNRLCECIEILKCSHIFQIKPVCINCKNWRLSHKIQMEVREVYKEHSTNINKHVIKCYHEEPLKKWIHTWNRLECRKGHTLGKSWNKSFKTIYKYFSLGPTYGVF